MGIKGVETFYLREKKIREDQTAKVHDIFMEVVI
jgi:hypothetical protein